MCSSSLLLTSPPEAEESLPLPRTPILTQLGTALHVLSRWGVSSAGPILLSCPRVSLLFLRAIFKTNKTFFLVQFYWAFFFSVLFISSKGNRIGHFCVNTACQSSRGSFGLSPGPGHC